MNFVPYIATSFGPRSLPHRPMLRVMLTRGELFAVIRQIEREPARATGRGP